VTAVGKGIIFLGLDKLLYYRLKFKKTNKIKIVQLKQIAQVLFRRKCCYANHKTNRICGANLTGVSCCPGG